MENLEERKEILQLEVKVLNRTNTRHGVKVVAAKPDGEVFSFVMSDEQAALFDWDAEDSDFMMGFDEEEVTRLKLQKFLAN